MSFLPMLAMGAMGALGGANVGETKGGFEKVDRFTPEQQAMMKQMYGPLSESMGLGFDKIQQILSGNPEAFAEFEAPMMRQFQQEIVPEIGNRFAGMGSHGSLSGSGLQQTLAQSGKELSEGLGALRAGLQQNAISQLGGFMNQAMTPMYENIYMQPTAGPFAGALQGMGQGMGNWMANKYLG